VNIDLIATQNNYMTHLRPVWDALPNQGVYRTHRGQNVTSDAVLVAGYRDVAFAKLWGYRRIALLEHGIGQSYGHGHPSYPGGEGRGDVGLFLSPNQTAARLDHAAYPNARVKIVGDPHIDFLPRRVPDGQTTVAVSFHWSGSRDVPELQSAQGHFEPALPALGRAFHVIGHSHPNKDLTQLYEGLGWEYVRDFDEVCRRADVYVCDNSSTIYEFASTGRPVVVLNDPRFRPNVEHGLRFWEAAWVGINIGDPSQLVAGVEQALLDPPTFQRTRELALNVVYQPRTNGTAYAVMAILDWLAHTQGVAA
jgi:hypothetical protein